MQLPPTTAIRAVSCAEAPATAFGPIYHVTPQVDGTALRTVQHPDGTKRELSVVAPATTKPAP